MSNQKSPPLYCRADLVAVPWLGCSGYSAVTWWWHESRGSIPIAVVCMCWYPSWWFPQGGHGTVVLIHRTLSFGQKQQGLWWIINFVTAASSRWMLNSRDHNSNRFLRWRDEARFVVLDIPHMQQEEKTLSPKHDQVREARDRRGECELILGHSSLKSFWPCLFRK